MRRTFVPTRNKFDEIPPCLRVLALHPTSCPQTSSLLASLRSPVLVVGWRYGVVVGVDESQDRWCQGCRVGDSVRVCKPVTRPPPPFLATLGDETRRGIPPLPRRKRVFNVTRSGEPLLVTLSYLQKWYVVSC